MSHGKMPGRRMDTRATVATNSSETEQPRLPGDRYVGRQSIGFSLWPDAADAGDIKPPSKLYGAHRPTDLTSAASNARNCRRAESRPFP